MDTLTRKDIMNKFLALVGGFLFLFQVVVISDVAANNTKKHKIRVQYLTYEVVKVQPKSITIRDRKGRVIILDKEPKGLRVGDMVRYDRLRFKLKRHPKKKSLR